MTIAMMGPLHNIMGTPKRHNLESYNTEILINTPSSSWSHINSEIDSAQKKETRPQESRRGRPRADAINSLITEGANSPSDIKCKICCRVFPRLKSLHAHVRTHNSERPYTCDFPGCQKSFSQSGQLKTHERLHTGEKPFKCTYEGCETRFTHQNRHCTEHPYAEVKRCPDSQFALQLTDKSEEAQAWLERLIARRKEKTPGRSSSVKREMVEVTPNTPETHHPFTPPIKRTKSKRELRPFMELQSLFQCDTENFHKDIPNARLVPSSPKQERVLRNFNILPVRNLDLDGIKPLCESNVAMFRSVNKHLDSFYCNENYEYTQTSNDDDRIFDEHLYKSSPVEPILPKPNECAIPKKRWLYEHKIELSQADEPLNLCTNRDRT